MPTPYERIYSLEELPAVVEALRSWAPGVPRWLLYGPLGAGKTQLVRAWLGPEVSSPTFTYIHPYSRGVHVDLYRFPFHSPSRWAELYDLLEEAPLIFVEWADKLPEPPPLPYVALFIEVLPNSLRKIRAILHQAAP
ncbi:MAG: tRNA (adenosine(37)-N6)-threonylcarbamoyltransferase complex ATPase subunit type 1 TsaE [Bacteroidia bacterium]|jgi:tRNA threonylcarbamoyl adenosine modification protein YjeE|nr:tRNA (adenosine(37)-N6)-threonylcarbamoyltransferase complex ATPase subunit type 1 TsaE [Bacteroidia bacterium]GIV23954.1 MAG: hypothetical protein KatS3mg025_1613 [Bacteroidia bacterium]